MKKWQIATAAGVAASAAAAAAFLLKRKNDGEGTGAEKPKPGKVLKNPGYAEYSFVSGYKETETVRVGFTYDADRFSYKTIEEEFLTYTDNAHVGALYGEEFNLQVEYTDFIAGENYEKHTAYLAEKYKGFRKTQYGGNEGCMYYDGDSTCFVFPATEFSCLLISVILNKNSKLKQEDVCSAEDISDMLSTLTIEK